MKQTYILAISGGVDSVVLLDKLAKVKPDWITYIVAHVNHGIRNDSADDERFVHELADKWGYKFESISLKLGKHANEAFAREKRYAFLFDLLKKYKAEAIITAHHQDDVLETMIVNMLRGTTARGLIGFQRKQVVRPFLDTPKKVLVTYARENDLRWREDSTNQEESYLRNYVRKQILPRMEKHRNELLSIRDKVQNIYVELDALNKRLLVQTIEKKALVRSRFVILPCSVQKELLACWLRLHGISFDSALLERAVLAMKVYLPGKQFQLSSYASLEMKKKTIVLNVRAHPV